MVIGIPTGNILEGKIKQSKLKLIQAWIEIYRDDLMADWRLQNRIPISGKEFISCFASSKQVLIFLTFFQLLQVENEGISVFLLRFYMLLVLQQKAL